VFLNAFRIRLALMGAGILVLCLYLLSGGRLGPADRGTIAIEYGMYPREFEGLEVAVDGQVVGTLVGHGSMTRAAFAIREGEREVRVIHPEYGCTPRRLEVSSGRTVMLILDIGSQVDESGVQRTMLYFQS
jgi:hypothetical protein